MFESFRKNIRRRKLEEAAKLLNAHGLSVVQIKVHTDGTSYIKCADGSLRKIGKVVGANK